MQFVLYLISFKGKIIQKSLTGKNLFYSEFFFKFFFFELEDREIRKPAHFLLEDGAKFGLLWKKESKWQPVKEEERAMT